MFSSAHDNVEILSMHVFVLSACVQYTKKKFSGVFEEYFYVHFNTIYIICIHNTYTVRVK